MPQEKQDAVTQEPASHPLEGLLGYLREHPEELLRRIAVLREKPFTAGEVFWDPPKSAEFSEPSRGKTSGPAAEPTPTPGVAQPAPIPTATEPAISQNAPAGPEAAQLAPIREREQSASRDPLAPQIASSPKQYGTSSSKEYGSIASTKKSVDGTREDNGWRISLADASAKMKFTEHLKRRWPKGYRWIVAATWVVFAFLTVLIVWQGLTFFSTNKTAPQNTDQPPHEALRSGAQQSVPDGWEGIGFIKLAAALNPTAEAAAGVRALVLVLLIASFFACLRLFFWQQFPLHEPDPLFDRMLQERSPAPIPASSVTDMLADPQFKNVFDRAQNTVFPLTRKAGADVNRFIKRPIDHLDPEGQCARFFVNHGVSAFKNNRLKLYDHLEREIREMLFAEVFDDPAFVYIYKRNQPPWRRVLGWLASFDFERAVKLFRKEGPSQAKPDKMQLAIAGLLLLLIFTILNQPKVLDRPPEPSSSTLTLARSDQLDALLQSLEKLAAKLAPPEPPLPPHVEVHVAPAPAPVVNVPITVPGPGAGSNSGSNLNQGTNINANIHNHLPTTAALNPATEPASLTSGSSLTNNVIVSPPLPPDSGKRPETPAATDGGDDFVRLDYPRTGQAGKGVETGSTGAPLTLHLPNGVACSYTIGWSGAAAWPRDPVSLKLQTAEKGNAKECPASSEVPTGSAAVFSATTLPSYSGLLHAYVSVEAFHRRHLPMFAKNYIVLRFHDTANP